MAENNAIDSSVKQLNEILTKAGTTEVVPLERGTSLKAFMLAYRTSNGVQLFDPKKTLDQYLEAPERRRGTAKVTTLKSFISLTNRYKDKDSAMFCDPTMNSASLAAVIDYNRDGAEAATRFGQHRVHYAFPYSDQWKAWGEIDGKWQDMPEFAEFMEDNILDIVQPEQIDPSKGIAQAFRALDVAAGSPEQMIALSKGMKLAVKKNITQVMNLTNGEVEFGFDVANSTKDGLPLVAPGGFVIGIPVFKVGAPVQIGVRFRYRAPEQGEHIKFKCDLYRLDQVFDLALQECLDKAIKDTALPLYMGFPEVG